MNYGNNTKPKNMVYTEKHKRELLFNGIYKDFNFYIISMGTHPCAYVSTPLKYLELYEKYNLDEIISVHGGITYDDDYLYTSYGTDIRGTRFIGWDYAHAGDYMGIPFFIKNLFDNSIFGDNKKWTTEEIIEHCTDVIDQLIELRDKDGTMD